METLEKIKKEVESKKVFKINAKLNEIKFEDLNVISFKGNFLKLQKEAWASLIRILGIKSTILRKVNKTKGTEYSKNILTIMKKALSDNQMPITLFVNKSFECINIQKGEIKTLSTGSVLKLIDFFLNEGLELDSKNVFDNGDYIFTFVRNKPIELFGTEETFDFGISLESLNGLPMINEFNKRLVCSNGMRIKQKERTLFLELTKNPKSFFEFLKDLKKREYVSTGFKEKVETAMNCKASLLEALQVKNKIENTFGKAEMRNQGLDLIYLDDVKNKIKSKGIEFNKLPKEAKKYIHTDYTVWELVNLLTNIGTFGLPQININNVSKNEINDLQIEASNLLYKENFDLQMMEFANI